MLRKYKWAIFDTISTGWGGVLTLNGEVVEGEPGHVNLGFDLPYVCGCGNQGCLEAMYSGSAMERRIRQHLQADLDVWDHFNKALETKEEWAVSLLAEWAEGVGRAWANVLNRIRRIQAIVYMGSTAKDLVPKAEPLIRTTIQRICMFPEHKEIPIVEAKASPQAVAVYGAVCVYLQLRDKTCGRKGEPGGENLLGGDRYALG